MAQTVTVTGADDFVQDGAVAYTIVLGIYTYITARDSTLSLVPPKEMVYELTKAAMVAATKDKAKA